jgi:glutamate carboxypeptidase
MSQALIDHLQNRLEVFLDELHQLVRMDSYSYEKEDVNRVVGWLEQRFTASHFHIERFPNATAGDDLLATRRGNGRGRIMLLGHSDTVYPRGTTATRPMRIEGDNILGPGTADMKAGYLAGLYAVEALDAIRFDDYAEIRFLIVSDEEIDERHAIPLIRRVSREVDVVLTLEAARANGDIVVARKGVRSFSVEAHGHAAHSGVEPEKGRNAIVALADRILALYQLNDPAQGVSVNPGVIDGGRLRNIVPDYARLRFEARAFSQAQLDATTAQIEALFAPSLNDVRFTIQWEQTSPPMPRTENIALLEVMTQSIATDLGFSVKGAHTGGAADAAFAAEEGIPVLDGLGPIGGLDHSPDEYILKSSIVPRIALLARLMQAISQTPSLHRPC